MTPTPTKKEWCGHIKFYSISAVTRKPVWVPEHSILLGPRYVIPDSWTRCPICGKERPK